jgi:hypothetical protein
VRGGWQQRQLGGEQHRRQRHRDEDRRDRAADDGRAHDRAAHDRAAHDGAAHDRAAHDRAAHNRATYNGRAYNGRASHRSAHDRRGRRGLDVRRGSRHNAGRDWQLRVPLGVGLGGRGNRGGRRPGDLGRHRAPAAVRRGDGLAGPRDRRVREGVGAARRDGGGRDAWRAERPGCRVPLVGPPGEIERIQVADVIASLQAARSAMDAERSTGAYDSALAGIARDRIAFFASAVNSLREPNVRPA